MNLTETQLREGFSLCIYNATRLVDNAELLFNNRRSSVNLAYSIWSFAMEEYGKALYLKDSYKKGNKTKCFCIEENLFCGKEAHKKKFNRAKSQLKALPLTIKATIRISSNLSQKNQTIKTSLRKNISVPLHTTGDFCSLDSGSDKTISVELRMESLYVNYVGGNWLYPEPILSKYPLKAKEILDSDDLKLCIKILKDELNLSLF